jgi:hypothetical protein
MKDRFSAEQMIGVLMQALVGVPLAEVIRRRHRRREWECPRAIAARPATRGVEVILLDLNAIRARIYRL